MAVNNSYSYPKSGINPFLLQLLRKAEKCCKKSYNNCNELLTEKASIALFCTKLNVTSNLVLDIISNHLKII